jgi:hypothetical protein
VVLEKSGEDEFHWSYEKMKKNYVQSRKKGKSYIQYKEIRLNGLVTSCVGTGL